MGYIANDGIVIHNYNRSSYLCSHNSLGQLPGPIGFASNCTKTDSIWMGD